MYRDIMSKITLRKCCAVPLVLWNYVYCNLSMNYKHLCLMDYITTFYAFWKSVLVFSYSLNFSFHFQDVATDIYYFSKYSNIFEVIFTIAISKIWNSHYVLKELQNFNINTKNIIYCRKWITNKHFIKNTLKESQRLIIIKKTV